MARTPTTLESTSLRLLDEARAGLKDAEQRTGQIEMTQAIARTMQSGGTLVVQAPTGTGKSLAYLCAVIAAQQRAVVVTSSIALQDQLIKKDLPFLAEQLAPRTIDYTVLKGRSNYLCRQKLTELTKRDDNVRERPQLVELDQQEHRIDDETLQRITTWADSTATGDRADLEFEPSGGTWSLVSTGSDECPGAVNCPHGTTCFAELARERAANAEIVVVNAHLYAMHVASTGRLLPEHEIVIFDEAHEVEAILTTALGSDLGAHNVRALGRATRHIIEDKDLDARIERSANELALGLGEVARSDAGFGPGDLRLVGGATSVEQLEVLLTEIERDVLGARDAINDRVPVDAPVEVRTRADRARLIAQSLIKRLEWARRSDEDVVVWVEAGRTIKSAPLDVGALLDGWFWSTINERLMDEGDEPIPVAPACAIFTSATIPNSIVERLRIPKANVIEVETPFDYRSNAILYVPNIADPKSGEIWKMALREELTSLITAAGGRTLALFTSISAMRQTAEYLREHFELPILVQDDLPKMALLKAFSEDEQAVLCGTRSFFHGVDVPGKSLSLVVLDRLPFPRPGDPLIEAWQDAAGGGFAGFSRIAIPLAASVLAQAAGRLIRSASDKGVVAVMDSRLATASYRDQLLKALPPMKRSRNREEVLTFLAKAVADN